MTQAVRQRRAGMALRLLVLLACLMLADPLIAAEALRVRLATGHPDEASARMQLLRLVDDNAVGRWIFTRDIVIRKGAIPHSHPELTLNAAHLDDDQAQLATFLHEQFHWYADTRQADVERAIEAFERRYPDAPFGDARGAESRDSTYLHLVVCDLELQAMTRLIGKQQARATLARAGHYTWIYAKVLDDPQVHHINVRYGLSLP